MKLLACLSVLTWSRLRPRHAIRWVVAFSVAVTLGLVAFGAMLLMDARTDAWTQAGQASENLVVSLSRDIARNIEMYDLVLKGIIAARQDPAFAAASPAIRQMAMFGRAASAEYLGSVVLTDAAGNAIADSLGAFAAPFNIADREHFKALRDDPELGLYIGRPVVSRLKHDLGVTVSRPVIDGKGRFAGVAVGILRLAYFEDMFDKIDLGRSGSMTLFRMDGRVLARRPARPGDIDADLSNTATFRKMENGVAGTFFGTAALDGVERFYTYRQVGKLPLILAVAVGVEDIYAPWRRKATGIGFVLGVLCCSSIASCVLFQAELRRRTAAERALRRAAERLEVMATTDALTGLRNRRALEDALAREWQRGHRAQRPLGVVMLDADFFKTYNDRYGHQAGDDVLRHLARTIDRFARRPADIGGRYGGEEFLLLLPDTDLHGAGVVAELIRAAVEAMAVPHAASPFGRVTVSVGVASAYPVLSHPPAALVRRADQALYEAKRAGRNRVVAASDVELGYRDGLMADGVQSVSIPG
jgi:diguanylate cyclase (GGDEF)-like protein